MEGAKAAINAPTHCDIPGHAQIVSDFGLLVHIVFLGPSPADSHAVFFVNLIRGSKKGYIRSTMRFVRITTTDTTIVIPMTSG